MAGRKRENALMLSLLQELVDSSDEDEKIFSMAMDVFKPR